MYCDRKLYNIQQEVALFFSILLFSLYTRQLYQPVPPSIFKCVHRHTHAHTHTHTHSHTSFPAPLLMKRSTTSFYNHAARVLSVKSNGGNPQRWTREWHSSTGCRLCSMACCVSIAHTHTNIQMHLCAHPHRLHFLPTLSSCTVVCGRACAQTGLT